MNRQVPPVNKDLLEPSQSRVLAVIIVLLSLAACGLMLLMPTRSISVTTVYKGF